MRRLVVSFALASAMGCKRAPAPSADPVPRPEVKNVMPSPVVSMHITGESPVEGEGTLRDGDAFYFRARYAAWSFSVGRTRDLALDEPSWSWEEPWGDRMYAAGSMPEPLARAIIESCAEMHAAKVPPPVEDAGMPAEQRKAQALARYIMGDIALYGGDAIAEAGARNVRTALAANIEEGRTLFRQRTPPAQHAVFEEAFPLLDAAARGEAYHAVWIRDEASARSVGRRWSAMLPRLGAGDQAKVRSDGARWLDRWVAPAVRPALTLALSGSGITLR